MLTVTTFKLMFKQIKILSLSNTLIFSSNSAYSKTFSFLDGSTVFLLEQSIHPCWFCLQQGTRQCV